VRVFLAGASGVIGVRIVPLLIAAGHEVAAMTRSPDKAKPLQALGARPVICNVYDPNALVAEFRGFGAQAVMHQLTDLPDDASRIPEFGPANSRIRREGTRNLIAAAQAAGATRFVAQSLAWSIAGDGGAAVDDLERAVLAIDGVVLRYGQFYGPGTYFEDSKPPPPRVQIDDAAQRSVVALLDGSAGVVMITE
jgi:nucleoside-diphosphate-sugar epimerase